MSEEIKQPSPEPKNDSMALDDEARIKVLSPGMLVAKRFFRNHLAMVGLIILVTMFLFSFIGGMVTPYGECQVFRKTEATWKDYAGASYNDSYQFAVKDGQKLPNAVQQKFILASGKNAETFEADGTVYSLRKADEELWFLSVQKRCASVLSLKGKAAYQAEDGVELSEELKKNFETADAAGETEFEADGVSYMIEKAGREKVISAAEEIAVATKCIFSAADSSSQIDYEFEKAALTASAEGAQSFETSEGEFALNRQEDSDVIEVLRGDEIFATISRMQVSPQGAGSFLSLEFKETVEAAIQSGEEYFTAKNNAGEEETYQLQKKNTQYMVRSKKNTTVNDTYHKPDSEHILGTDGNGMDMLTRLMYGGRISLMIGFVVIFIEILIGICIGGVSGYFGGWVDTLLMRVVDVVICIPAMPLYIILGAVMDYYQIDPRIRIYLLCVILGLLGWPGIARMVRGQILSLREQEFMIATEATGVRVSRRIFKHLIPNVIPQLIVIATMGLGDIILMEATLSFLGLGVKFPYASWGNIVNAVNDIYVLTNYWFVWIPAGFLILITVLGFNFVGDGLRDAFDPKMKR